jgi:hypothetical protein
MWPYGPIHVPRNRGLVRGKGGQRIAHGHMAPHMTTNLGARVDKGSSAHMYSQKWVFFNKFGFFMINVPIISIFSPFLEDIGHFWRPNSWRKLEMRNQLQGYIN